MDAPWIAISASKADRWAAGVAALQDMPALMITALLAHRSRFTPA